MAPRTSTPTTDGNEEVAFLPVEVVSSPEVIATRKIVLINGALGVDVRRPGRRRHHQRSSVLRDRQP
ncbi:MAG: hypothetical protein U0R24_10520 [Solirubrobacterales bacterium]